MLLSSSRLPGIILRQALTIILVGGVLAGVANFIHPHRIPWVQDWGSYVEAKAVQAGIEVVPLSLTYSIHQAGNHLFVDARSALEFEKGHVPGALSLPFGDLKSHIQTLEQVLDSNLPLVVYCRNRECDDALLLATELLDMGKSNLIYYVDGFELWEDSGCLVDAL